MPESWIHASASGDGPVLDSSYGADRATALLASPGETSPKPDAADEADAALQLRRLANRHGCHPRHCPHPDPGVHNADVAWYREWLQALGLMPYEAMPNPRWKPSGTATSNYERPGR